MRLLPLYWKSSFLPQQQNWCCQHRILFCPERQECFTENMVLPLCKCFQTSASDAGIRGLDFSCMTLDVWYVLPLLQWSRETEGWTDRQVPSKSNSAICRELRVTALLAQVLWEEPNLQQEDRKPKQPSLWFSPPLTNRPLYISWSFSVIMRVCSCSLRSYLFRECSFCVLLMHIVWVWMREAST